MIYQIVIILCVGVVMLFGMKQKVKNTQKKNSLRMENKMQNEKQLFSATMVLTAYIDEEGNVKYVKSSWDDLFKKEEENA